MLTRTRALFSLCVLLLLTSCIQMTPTYITLPGPARRDDVTATVNRAVRAPYGYVGFRGAVMNESERVLPECRITIRVFDHEMNPIGRARATVEDLQPGESRDYYAKFSRTLKIVRTVYEPELRLFWDRRPGS